MLKGFRDFIMRGNLVQIAFVIATAFATVVIAFVGFIMSVVSKVAGGPPNLNNMHPGGILIGPPADPGHRTAAGDPRPACRPEPRRDRGLTRRFPQRRTDRSASGAVVRRYLAAQPGVVPGLLPALTALVARGAGQHLAEHLGQPATPRGVGVRRVPGRRGLPLGRVGGVGH